MPRPKLKICGIVLVTALVIYNCLIINDLVKENKKLISDKKEVGMELELARQCIFYLDGENQKLKKEIKWRKKSI